MTDSEGQSVEVIDEAITYGDLYASTPTCVVRIIDPSWVVDRSEDHRDKEVNLLLNTE